GILAPEVRRKELEAMTAVQHHRGPDDRGVALLEGDTVGLGHNRLSIIDLSQAGHQPMLNAGGGLTIVFNGEVYNYRELKQELSGYPFRGDSDTEVVLAAYERWGENCLERFVGMFAFAIWDAEKRHLFCARDRLGVKPFHYAQLAGRFLFASEVKALLAAGVPAAPDGESWGLYLAHGVYELPGRTFFKEVQALPPAHAMTVAADGTQKQWRYWDLAERAAEPLDADDDTAADEVRALLEESARLRLRADVPVGVMLSGGLDSAAVMTTVDRLLPEGGEIETFTGVFGDSRYDEDDFSEKVPRQARWRRNLASFPVERVWDLTDQAVWHQEAPFGGVSTLLYHQVHELAKERGITVLLEGQGGDELFAGYGYFRPPYYLDLLESGGWRALRREVKATPGESRDWLSQARLLRAGREAQVYYDGSSHLRADCISEDVRNNVSPPTYPAPFGDHLRNVLYRDLCITKLPRVLRMNDRVSMAYSRELRQPLIDHRLVEHAFRLPGMQKIRGGQGKFLLRHAMRRDLPEEVRGEPKRFVVTPQREWLVGPLAGAVTDIVESREFRDRGLFDVAEVRRAWKKFREGDSKNAFFVWQWVNTELWFRRFADGRADILNVA
ncbi:MAG: asparagine synthase (glutamine-hydrolyzing), partial [Alphaproteobacteria bacterium]|nr:asparagine synthase (glutamine-hydrolyzing) [Alphaproteobacteria bacterium]